MGGSLYDGATPSAHQGDTMTINEVITQLQAVKENQYDDATLVRWISDLERTLYNDIIKGREGDGMPPEPYDVDSDMDTELLVPDPYSDIYIKYLSAQVDYHNAETARYTNSMIMYNLELDAFSSWYNRTHMHRQDNYVRC